MKTINENIDIFRSETAAFKAFNSSKVPCQLLKSTFLGTNYFIDRSKTAIKDWPNKYRLIDEK
jgi:hypothetical protein